MRRERDARAGKVVVDTEHGRGDLGGGGREGGPKPSMGQTYIVLNIRPESSVWVSSARGLEHHHLIMSKLSGHGDQK